MYPWESLVPILTTPHGSSSPLLTLSPPLSAPPMTSGPSSSLLDSSIKRERELKTSDDLDALGPENEPVDLVPTAEDDDDVFEPDGSSNTEQSVLDAAAAGKRRTQSLSALQNSKEPQSPQKVQSEKLNNLISLCRHRWFVKILICFA